VKRDATDCALLASTKSWVASARHGCRRINRGANLARDIPIRNGGGARRARFGHSLGRISQVFERVGRELGDPRRLAPPGLARRSLRVGARHSSIIFPTLPHEESWTARVTTKGRRLPGSFGPVRRVDERDLPYTGQDDL